MSKTMNTRYGEGDASYQAAGQFPGIRKLVEAFYHYMDSVPDAAVIRKMHPDDLSESKNKLASFLSGWLGGPRLYKEQYGGINIPGFHRHLGVGVAERDAWLLCMKKAIADQPFDDDFKQYLLQQLAIPAERVRQACNANQK